MKLDGVRKWRLENRNVRRFSNVKIWAAQCRHGFPPANAYIDNLQYDLIGKTHIYSCLNDYLDDLDFDFLSHSEN